MTAAANVFSGPTADKVKRSYQQSSKLYGKAEYFAIRNDVNSYLVYFQWVKSTVKTAEKILIGLPEPVFRYGFIARNFMHLTVNGISSTQLEPKSIAPFTRDGTAGIKALYNFDGVKMTLRFYMTEKSPLLFMEWLKDPASEEEIAQAELGFAVYPSYTVPNGGKPDEQYRREILTPARKIVSPQKTAWIALKPEDTALLMYDTAFEAPAEPKAQGPCFMAIDWNGIDSGRVWFGKIYCMSFRFVLNPKASRWRFGLLEFKKPMRNQEFMNYKNKHEALLKLAPVK